MYLDLHTISATSRRGEDLIVAVLDLDLAKLLLHRRLGLATESEREEEEHGGPPPSLFEAWLPLHQR
jgi:hypothetical protein